MDPEDRNEIRVAVVGRPNVGKSSFVNRIFGEERVVVNEAAGTTRDPVDSPLVYHGHTLVFVDTAGLRRQSRVKDSLEYYGALRTARVLHEADIALVLIDATDGLNVQDLKVAEMAWESGCGSILVVNKWGPGGEGHADRAAFREAFARTGAVPEVGAHPVHRRR